MDRGKLMRKIVQLAAIAGVIALTGCAQMSANKNAPALEAKIEDSSQRYIACVEAYAKKYGSVADSATIVAEGANSECYYLIDDVRVAMTELAASRYMSKSYQDKIVKDKVEELEKRAQRQVIDMVVKSRLGEF